MPGPLRLVPIDSIPVAVVRGPTVDTALYTSVLNEVFDAGQIGEVDLLPNEKQSTERRRFTATFNQTIKANPDAFGGANALRWYKCGDSMLRFAIIHRTPRQYRPRRDADGNEMPKRSRKRKGDTAVVQMAHITAAASVEYPNGTTPASTTIGNAPTLTRIGAAE